MPRPCASVCSRSSTSSIGSPKNCVAALLLDLEQRALDGADRRRRDVAVLGRELRRVVADELQHRAQVLQIEQQQPVVVGDLEDEREHALLRRVQARTAGRAAAGPRSEIVARTGKPRLPNTSQNDDRVRAPGRLRDAGRLQPLAQLRRRATRPRRCPDRSPFTSAMNTGTPMREKCSASICSVTVLPVPVAPVIEPVAVGERGTEQDLVRRPRSLR